MKKIGICACYDTKNYGSMLQAFATQIAIDKLGFESEYIVYKKKKTLAFLLKQIPRFLNANLMHDKLLGMQKKAKLSKYPKIREKDNIRCLAFKEFQKRYYRSFSSEYYGYDELKVGARHYDSVVVGSDQLWTPGGLASNFYNLMFVPDEINKISYATSFGVGTIPWYQKKRTKQYLDRINYLSVREIKGAELIKKLTDRDAKVVSDPTLLLSKLQWDELIPLKRLVREPYIFCYFLGGNPEHRKIAMELQLKTGLKIVTTPFLDSFVLEDLNFGDEHLFDVAPDDFVNLIRGAEFVVTDSFHGSIFSILNHKKFVTLNRFKEGSKNSRNSRIDSLCGILGLHERRYVSDIFKTISKEIDYDLVDKKIEVLRSESMEYLQNALDKR